MTKVLCDFCKQPFCHTDVDALSLPVTPEMFTSIMPENGVPDPFHPSLEWEDFKCPFCRLRPFEKKDEITVMESSGKGKTIKITEKYRCAKCGREYQHQSSLSRHIKDCNGN